jgi:hypothetical protein
MTKNLQDEINTALDVMYTGWMNTTVTTAVLKGVMLRTGGWILCRGRKLDIKYKHLGGGAYKIWTEESK